MMLHIYCTILLLLRCVIYLFQVISEQHPRSLLILDDVWSKEVAQCFAVRCRTMVTSRKSTVANSVTTPHVYTVSVSEGTVCGGEGGREGGREGYGGGERDSTLCVHAW